MEQNGIAPRTGLILSRSMLLSLHCFLLLLLLLCLVESRIIGGRSWHAVSNKFK